MKYVCQACGFVYDEELGDPERGIASGTKFEDLPEDYTCAWCGAGKDMFAAQQFNLLKSPEFLNGLSGLFLLKVEYLDKKTY